MFTSVEEVRERFRQARYIASRRIATAVQRIRAMEGALDKVLADLG